MESLSKYLLAVKCFSHAVKVLSSINLRLFLIQPFVLKVKSSEIIKFSDEINVSADCQSKLIYAKDCVSCCLRALSSIK